PEVTENNRLGVHMGNGATEEDKKTTLAGQPVDAVPLPPQSAKDAYEVVLISAGASYRRDTLDERIINDVKNRTGTFIDVQGGYPHGTAYEQTVNAWPTLKSIATPVDIDKDGIPDVWEKRYDLDPGDAADATQLKLHTFYTNIEVYINRLTK
ncbi:MAG: pectate lyase, partial [Chitinophagaceae bacterium]